MSAGPLEFWFDFASTYSYPAAMRLEAAASRAGVPIAWRPFLLGPIFQAQGWNDSPFNPSTRRKARTCGATSSGSPPSTDCRTRAR
jgi:2-hydroxychromene-2-carboxylate isomerase